MVFIGLRVLLGLWFVVLCEGDLGRNFEMAS